MAKYRKKSDTFEASQWFKDGDHDAVSPYRDRKPSDVRICCACVQKMDIHGWLHMRITGRVVCPGDWIVKKSEGGTCLSYSPDDFEATYELVDEPTPACG